MEWNGGDGGGEKFLDLKVFDFLVLSQQCLNHEQKQRETQSQKVFRESVFNLEIRLIMKPEEDSEWWNGKFMKDFTIFSWENARVSLTARWRSDSLRLWRHNLFARTVSSAEWSDLVLFISLACYCALFTEQKAAILVNSGSFNTKIADTSLWCLQWLQSWSIRNSREVWSDGIFEPNEWYPSSIP